MEEGKSVFDEFVKNNGVIDVSLPDFAINLVLTAVLTYILGKLYAKFASGSSDRGRFGANFVLIGVTTMIIITIVKSSLALSLGLVGALSIVRFRAAIKEPEELAYIFFTIALGLGFGADQRLITLVGFIALALIIFIKYKEESRKDSQNYHFTVQAKRDSKLLTGVVDVLKKNALRLDMKRLDESANRMEAAFRVEFEDFASFNTTKEELHALEESVKVSFIDQKGL